MKIILKVTHFLPGSYPVFSLTLPFRHDIIVMLKTIKYNETIVQQLPQIPRRKDRV